MANKAKVVEFTSAESRNPKLLAKALRRDGSLDALIRKYSDEDTAKMLVLCQNFGIDAGPATYYQLALTLCRKLYPERKRTGAKLKWSAIVGGILVVEIERLAKKGDASHGTTWAASQLAKKEPWKSFIRRSESAHTSHAPAEALRRAYYNSRNSPYAKKLRNTFNSMKKSQRLVDWDELVADLVKKSSTN